MLRLWSADVKIEGTETPLFVGTVEEQEGRVLADLITVARDAGGHDGPLNRLEKAAREELAVRRVHRTSRETRIDHQRPWARWQGEVLLVW